MPSQKTTVYSKFKNKTKNKSNSRKVSNKKINPWNKYGSVYSSKHKKYYRLGSPQSIKVIVNELYRDKEWKKRVNYMMNNNGSFAMQLKKHLKN